MSINQAFSAGAENVTAVRASMNKRLGEIIADVIGDERIKALMEAGGHAEAAYAGKPTGQIALELNVITPDTKTALLIAQAAERTYQLADKAEAISTAFKQNVQSKTKVSDAEIVTDSDPVFKFVGSPRDPEALQRAQGTWMAAQMLLNNEIWATNSAISDPGSVTRPLSQSAKSAQGFKKAAAELYITAADLLAKEGHDNAAKSLKSVAQALSATLTQGKAPTPGEVMRSLEWDVGKGNQDLFIILSDERYLERQPIQEVYDRLAALTGGAETTTIVVKPATQQPK